MPRIPFMPRQEQFFELFEGNARNIVRAAQRLKELVYSWENVEMRVNEITELEHEGDRYTHQIMAQLHRTFVTPFDREDIALLAHSLDDITDYIQAAADAMFVYKVKAPGQRAKELCDVVVQAALEVEKAMPQLRGKVEAKRVFNHCVEINRLENVADDIFRSAIAELFDSENVVDLIKWREIYEDMEKATDRCEDVADVLEGVVLKHA